MYTNRAAKSACYKNATGPHSWEWAFRDGMVREVVCVVCGKWYLGDSAYARHADFLYATTVNIANHHIIETKDYLLFLPFTHEQCKELYMTFPVLYEDKIS